MLAGAKHEHGLVQSALGTHRFMPEAFTLPSVHDFPWKDPKQEHWEVLEQILMQIRPKLMRDSYRLRTAPRLGAIFCRMLISIFRQMTLQ